MYNFCINDFEGPLDLLLHLVKTSKMDIYDIDIKIIIDEYLNFIETEKNHNIDIASSYLVMASELIHLKSKMLVNLEDEEESTDEFSINSEEELKQKIIEYEKYKEVTEALEEKRLYRNNFYTRSPSKLSEYTKDETINFGSVSLEDLLKAINDVIERKKLSKPLNTHITKKEYNLDLRINDIRKILEVRPKIEFIELFSDTTREFIIVTFLSILTMSKNKEIRLTQENNFETILIEKSDVNA